MTTRNDPDLTELAYLVLLKLLARLRAELAIERELEAVRKRESARRLYPPSAQGRG